MADEYECLGVDLGREPVISIQSDWEYSLFMSRTEVWVSCKFRGEDSTHSKLTNYGGTFNSDAFTVTSYKPNRLTLKHNSSGHLCTFIPPYETFGCIHNKKIISLDLADEDLAVSVCNENNMVVWNTRSGDKLQTLSGHIINVYRCKFFPSGIVVLSGGADMQLKIWCAKTGACPVTLMGHTASVNDFCIVDKGRNIISVSKDGTARLWDCGKSECLGVIFSSRDALNCCALGVKEDITGDGREDSVSEREIGTRNKFLLAGSEEGYVYGIAVYVRRQLFKLDLLSAVNVILINEHKFAIGCQSGKIQIYEFKNEAEKLQTYFVSNSAVISGCLFKGNNFFMGRHDGTVTCYQFDTGNRKCLTLTGPDCDPVTTVCCRNNEIFTGCRDAKIRRYVIEEI